LRGTFEAKRREVAGYWRKLPDEELRSVCSSPTLLNLNNVNQLIFVMVKCGVLFEVRTEFLNNIYTSFGFKGF
jgi:hypothetical protein